MESLVHYQTLLVRRHHAALGDEDCERLRANSLELLQKLEMLDPLRKQRYRDLGENMIPITVFAAKLKLFAISCGTVSAIPSNL